MDSYAEVSESPQMLPPPPGTFIDREELIQYVGEFGVTQGYVVTIKQSKKDKVVVLGCDRGGVYRNRRKPVDEASGERTRNRTLGSRLTNCPFELLGKKVDGAWVLIIKNGLHNHEALKDIAEHPSARRFTEKEVMLIKEMTEAGLKPRQILKRLRQSNPDLLSTSKHVYNIKAKIRQGNLTVRRLKTLRPETSTEGNSQSSASTTEPSWKRQYPSRIPNLIGGRFVDSQSSKFIDVINPATQEVVSQVPLTTAEELRAAIFAAKRASLSWRNTPLITRKRIMFKLQELILRDIDKIALNITIEQGKTLKDARNDILRGLEVVEHACGMVNLQMVGEFVPNVLNGTDSYSIREPHGICAGICSSNFPAMVPLWMFPIAISCGNTFILKPSEKVPGACLTLAELATEAGLPSGVLNIIHGTNDIINAIFDDDEIKAISFVGADAGTYINSRSPANGKCIQSNVRAKNHAIVLPDANMAATLDALVASGFGAAGQRCMTINVVVFVGCSKSWEDKLVEHTKSLKVNAGTEPDADLGPVISKQVKEKLCRLIQSGVASGARLVLDGRQIMVPNYELGNFIGPTILSDVTNNMDCYKEDIIGPVLLCMQADSLDEAISIVNIHKYGTGASIFTTSAAAARKFQTEIEARQVGINVPVPEPLPFCSFTGSRLAFSGDLNFYCKSGAQLYTQIKAVTQQWKNIQCSYGASLVTPSNNFLNMDSVFPPSPSNELPSPGQVALVLQSNNVQSSDDISLAVQ